MQVSDALFGLKRFSFGNLIHDVFLTDGELVTKVSPQITILESTKSGRERRIISHDSHKSNFYFTTEQKNRLNTHSHRLLGGSSEVPKNYYVKSKII